MQDHHDDIRQEQKWEMQALTQSPPNGSEDSCSELNGESNENGPLDGNGMIVDELKSNNCQNNNSSCTNNNNNVITNNNNNCDILKNSNALSIDKVNGEWVADESRFSDDLVIIIIESIN